ncbi:MAG: glycosyltransferase [Bythopirellula sp.]|nr:glycosyltransferase [Bythopirellula sp.]
MQDPLSIVHFFPRIRLEEGGVVQTVLDLCRSLAEKGHHVTLATSDATDVASSWKAAEPNCPRFLELPRSTWLRSRLSIQALKNFESILGTVDVVHLHTPWELSNLQLSNILFRKQVPYIVTVHGMLDDYSMRQKGVKKRAYLALGGRRLFRRATTVHFTAEAEKEQALPWIPGKYLSVVQACAMDLTPYENLPGPESALTAFPQLNSPRQKILFLSRLHPKKGVDLLLRAASLLKSQGFKADLLIAGPGDEAYVNELKQLANQLGLSDSTHFLGMVRGSVKLSLYELADVFVLPTHQENFGLVLPEALACGTPVVTTRGTDIWRELAEAGATIVENQPSELARAISEILSNAERRLALGEQGRQYVKNWLAEDKVLAGYEQMYRDTIDRAAQN